MKGNQGAQKGENRHRWWETCSSNYNLISSTCSKQIPPCVCVFPLHLPWYLRHLADIYPTIFTSCIFLLHIMKKMHAAANVRHFAHSVLNMQFSSYHWLSAKLHQYDTTLQSYGSTLHKIQDVVKNKAAHYLVILRREVQKFTKQKSVCCLTQITCFSSYRIFLLSLPLFLLLNPIFQGDLATTV